MDDLLHAVAYGGQGLGRRSVPTPERVEELLKKEGRQRVEEWKNEWWLSEKAAERMVLVAVGGGLDHHQLEEEAEKSLGWVGKPVDEKRPRTRREKKEGLLGRLVASLGLSKRNLEPSYEEMVGRQTAYAGGKVCLDEGGEKEWLEGGTQVVLGFEGLREGEEDEVRSFLSLARPTRHFMFRSDGQPCFQMVLEVVATLLGGRKSYQPGSFFLFSSLLSLSSSATHFSNPAFIPLSRSSTGGPGTGMRSRLFLNILAKDPSVLSAKAFNLSYSDSGSSPLPSLPPHLSPFPLPASFKLTPQKHPFSRFCRPLRHLPPHRWSSLPDRLDLLPRGRSTSLPHPSTFTLARSEDGEGERSDVGGGGKSEEKDGDGVVDGEGEWGGRGMFGESSSSSVNFISFFDSLGPLSSISPTLLSFLLLLF